MDEGCRFCEIIRAGDFEDRYADVVGFAPLNPVADGHFLVVPVRHVTDALTDPVLTGRVMQIAARWAVSRGLAPCNLLTSVGAAASQSVFHLHAHIVPRRDGDGLMLPWTEQQKRALAATLPRRVEAMTEAERHALFSSLW